MSKSGFYRRYNKMIREQYAGGNELLDALELMSKIAARQQGTEAGEVAGVAMSSLHSIRNAIVEEIKQGENEKP